MTVTPSPVGIVNVAIGQPIPYTFTVCVYSGDPTVNVSGKIVNVFVNEQPEPIFFVPRYGKLYFL